LLISTLTTAGCGTVANLVVTHPEEGGKTPFGGVRQDVGCIKKAANGELAFETPAQPESGQRPQVGLLVLCAADLPLSMIGDVLTWPYTVVYSFINQPIPIPPVTQVSGEGWPQNSP
jgi:hypothetical protein